MKFEETKLRGLLVITPGLFNDSRGFLMEVFQKKVFQMEGISADFLQVNHSLSKRGVIRGLHFQWDKPLGKLMRVLSGRAFIAAADIRKNSPTFGQWIGEEFSAENKKILWAPPGFATGFCALGDDTEMEYFYTALYNSKGEAAIIWNDADIGIKWPAASPIVSERDSSALTFKEWLARPESNFFKI